jgi:outer membrane protein OmpA-like peptidoglycan-associated protein
MNIKNKITLLFILLAGAHSCMCQLEFDSLALINAAIINEKEINTEHLEFCPAFYNDYILFVKSNKENGKDDNMDDYFLDLAYAAKNNKGNLSKNAFFPLSVNTTMHEGQAAFDDINHKLYFTRSFYNIDKGTKRDTIVLKIYEANKSDNFEHAKVLSFSSDKFNSCHPTLNRNGDFMIFSSNMPGSKGMDLYGVKKIGTGWSDPINLATVNTNVNEVFPYLYKDSLLVFSANQPKSIGGYDFYYSALTDTGWTSPQTLPYPINSSFDDIGFALNSKGNQGYFSSNRPGGKGKDDIYRFESNSSFVRKTSNDLNVLCAINAIDKLSFIGIKEANITISEIDLSKNATNKEIAKGQKDGELILKISDEGKVLNQLISDEIGNCTVSLQLNKSYLIKFNAVGYEEQLLIYNPQNFGKELTIVANPKKTVFVPETKKENSIIIPTEIGSVVVFNNIYYEYGSAEIKIDAANELELLYNAMLSNPTMRVQLSSHTDSRGTSLYNNQLSAQRAQSAKNYLVKKGIDASRIVGIGFGESRIRNNCTDGIKCSDEEHLYNRRTEVLIIE